MEKNPQIFNVDTILHAWKRNLKDAELEDHSKRNNIQFHDDKSTPENFRFSKIVFFCFFNFFLAN